MTLVCSINADRRFFKFPLSRTLIINTFCIQAILWKASSLDIIGPSRRSTGNFITDFVTLFYTISCQLFICPTFSTMSTGSELTTCSFISFLLSQISKFLITNNFRRRSALPVDCAFMIKTLPNETSVTQTWKHSC